ncbi:MAG: 16S rRNA (guanine(527)-N(7))-methyltransferase RsmG [Aquisalimonadaceae bacterium]
MSEAAFPRPIVEERLRAGLARLARDTAFPVAALVDYLALLHRWNRAYNLSAVRDPEAMVEVHLLDSLALLPYLESPSLLDVGSGAGLPGIPLALCRPDLQVTLLDSNGKKTRFLNQVRLELNIGNLDVVQARIQDYRHAQGFSTIVSRAYARLDAFVSQVTPLLAAGGVILAMKARFDESAETAALPESYGFEILPLEIPGLDARRTLVRLRNRQRT